MSSGFLSEVGDSEPLGFRSPTHDPQHCTSPRLGPLLRPRLGICLGFRVQDNKWGSPNTINTRWRGTSAADEKALLRLGYTHKITSTKQEEQKQTSKQSSGACSVYSSHHQSENTVNPKPSWICWLVQCCWVCGISSSVIVCGSRN